MSMVGTEFSASLESKARGLRVKRCLNFLPRPLKRRLISRALLESVDNGKFHEIYSKYAKKMNGAKSHHKSCNVIDRKEMNGVGQWSNRVRNGYSK